MDSWPSNGAHRRPRSPNAHGLLSIMLRELVSGPPTATPTPTMPRKNRPAGSLSFASFPCQCPCTMVHLSRYSIRLRFTVMPPTVAANMRLYRRVGAPASAFQLVSSTSIGPPLHALPQQEVRIRVFESNTRRLALQGRLQHAHSRHGWSCSSPPYINGSVSVTISYEPNPRSGSTEQCVHNYKVRRAKRACILHPSAACMQNTSDDRLSHGYCSSHAREQVLSSWDAVEHPPIQVPPHKRNACGFSTL